MITAAIIPAAGKGLRMGVGIPKQFHSIRGEPLILRTLAVFEACPEVDVIMPVLPSDYVEIFRDILSGNRRFTKIVQLITGGEHRQDSVYNGIARLAPEVEIVVVHDGVRPFISKGLIKSCIETAWHYGAAVAAMSAQDTVKRINEHGLVEETLPREQIYLAQTPQAFRRKILVDALHRAKEEGYYGTDEASLVERMGVAVKIVPGERWNIKITTPEDLAWAQIFSDRQT
jgi:2-C-methyl-D-erythritol 4-phosphate cytidylyltransferase